jgi:membrane-bound lytic murein transglycosylase B
MGRICLEQIALGSNDQLAFAVGSDMKHYMHFYDLNGPPGLLSCEPISQKIRLLVWVVAAFLSTLLSIITPISSWASEHEISIQEKKRFKCPSVGIDNSQLSVSVATNFASSAQGITFSEWLDEFVREAIAYGIPEGVVIGAAKGISYEPKVIQLDRRQAEYNQTFTGYLNSRASEGLIALGKKRLAENRSWLDKVSKTYGVPNEVLIALWGLESGFGRDIGDQSTLSVLASLAYDGRRPAFFREQLLAALRIIADSHISVASMNGSWAGAIGQMQFMPTTFLKYAVDGDGNGVVDILASKKDALVSAANYLSNIGWIRGEPWGMEVRLSEKFDPYFTDLSIKRSNDEWEVLGVRTIGEGSLPPMTGKGSIVLPSGIQGPAFLVYDNFSVITQWNRSIFYALSVGYFSQRIAGGPTLKGKAPPDEQRLRRAEVVSMQQDLYSLGLYCGELDGMVGMETRQALRDYQRSRAMVADGYPTPAVISQLASEAQGKLKNEHKNQ